MKVIEHRECSRLESDLLKTFKKLLLVVRQRAKKTSLELTKRVLLILISGHLEWEVAGTSIHIKSGAL